MTAVALPATRRLDPRTLERVLTVIAVVVVAALYLAFRGQWTLPYSRTAPVFDAFAGIRDWIDGNRGLPIFVVVDAVRTAVDQLVELFITVVHSLGWPGVVSVAAALGYLAGGIRLAALMLVGFVFLGALGLWNEALDTLALTLAAVLLSLLVGVPLGILSARSDRLQRVISPILDAMQIMPTFAYLLPMVLLFRIGGASAAIATLIYAMPATIRITSLGIRGVPPASVEAAESLGATRWQILRKVELPLASRVLGLAVNQTIMLALGMVVITVLIDAPGLGQPILRGLQQVNVGLAFDAGVAIVVLAVLLDRLTERFSARLDARRHLDARELRRHRVMTTAAAVVAVVGIAIGGFLPDGQDFPDAISVSFRAPINDATLWVKANLYVFTDAVKGGFTDLFLNPFEGILKSSPWWLIVAVVFLIALRVGGLRSAVTAAVCLLLVAGLSLWENGMATLASVLVATAVALLIGLLFGILSARSDAIATLIRPGLDFAQTMPSFVYLIPAIALFGPSRFTGIVAAVIYAVPPVIRLVDAGIRSVPATIVEAATAAGSTERQLLWKVQLPVARPALLLAANQGIVMVLAMVVVAGLVGGGALGFDVVSGFSQRSDFGKGLAAGIAIVLLGIMLDRITQGAGRRQTEATEVEAVAATDGPRAAVAATTPAHG